MPRNHEDIQHIVMICNGSDCLKKGAKNIGKAARKCSKELGCNKKTIVIRTKCTGLCKSAPVVALQPSNEWITQATPKKVVKALQAALIL